MPGPPAASHLPRIFNPDARMPRLNRSLVYLSARLNAGIWLV
jgi:hypothetical protein